jgi:endonuclease G
VSYERVQGETVDFVPIAYLDIARVAACSVGRIIFRAGAANGTGVLISDQLVLTNNHVIGSPDEARGQSLQLNYERDMLERPVPVTEYDFDPDRLFITSDERDLDYTIVALGERIGGTSAIADFGARPLSSAVDKHAEGDFVTIVQHPSGDYKQIVLRENRVLGRGAKQVTLYYGTDTLPGSSGSPVFNDQYDLVALHHAGSPSNDDTLEGGGEPPATANEGIRVSAIVADVVSRRSERDASQEQLIDGAIRAVTHVDRGADEPRRGRESSNGSNDSGLRHDVLDPAPVAPNASQISGELLVPLELKITITTSAPGANQRLTDDRPRTPSPGRLERNQAPAADYENRDGYAANFLGRALALPRPSTTLQDQLAINIVDHRSSVFDYWHFSASIHAERRMPIFTAVNIDGPTWKQINRQTRIVTDPFEAGETWYPDPRISEDDQLSQSDYTRISARFDRGHLVRREDPQWGDPDTALRAMDDTFHLTNSCPQNWKFNQSPALWQGIENYVLNGMRATPERVTVFSGPIFAENDPLYGTVQVPLRFWKIIARKEDDHLRATGFVASQKDVIDVPRREALGTRDWPITATEPIHDFQAAIATIEGLTGLTFPAALHEADTKKSGFETLTEDVGLTPISRLDHADW